MQNQSSLSPWPDLEFSSWRDTLETLHMWTQVVGKVRLALTPWTNHSWHVPLYVTPLGLTTSTIFVGARRLDIEFDFGSHELRIRTSDGRQRALALEPRSVASFYAEVMDTLRAFEFDVTIHKTPNEVADPIPFDEDTLHSSYDPEAVTRFAQVLGQSARLFTDFRAGFLGKNSPVHFFWGSFDLAVTRFSGRSAPPHPGGIPGLPDWITREAYSHEVYSCGFWPGSAASPSPAYYAYAYPVPGGLGEVPGLPAPAFWSKEMGEYFLPYESVRTAADPDALLLNFLEVTYNAVADLAQWNRAELETPEGYPRV